MLKSHDILIVLKLVAIDDRPWSYAPLAVELSMSPSQLHSGIKRAVASRLALQQEGMILPNIRNLKEFIIHGLKYVFTVKRGELTRGIPTGYAAPPLNEIFIDSGNEPPPVWPHPEGNVRGISFSPLSSYAPQAALADGRLYELLVLVDAIRGGRAREQKIAVDELEIRLNKYYAKDIKSKY
ncbi:MAG: hypothetical protein RBT80_24695 [Candidatus Vecturithrix sp.]|jgi:hypothetical protein|nr:hypothetical protein [Candidatus Vecturithrix sp.]